MDVTSDTKSTRIRELNDDLRKYLIGGSVIMTEGIAALGPDAVKRIVQTIAVYEDFCKANDPHGEHDFGAFPAEGQTVFFKIDYYNKALSGGSPDPSDPTMTERVLTLMLAEEY